MRFRPIGLLLSVVVVASSACSMDATEPSSLAAAASVSKESADWQYGSNDRLGEGVAATYVVRFNPNRDNVLHFGAHTVEIPAGAVCNEESGYGLEFFDQDCDAQHGMVTVTAVVQPTERGLPRIDFMPDMRFTPRSTVTLRLSVPDLSARTRIPRILYCPTFSSQDCIDEGALDPSLATNVDAATGTVFRRIKHFTGYFVDN